MAAAAATARRVIREPSRLAGAIGCVVWLAILAAIVLTMLIMLQQGCAPCVCAPDPDPGVHQVDGGDDAGVE